MKHIINTPSHFLRDIIIAFASSIITEDIHHDRVAMLAILEDHNYGKIRGKLNKIDAVKDKEVAKLLQDHREVAKYRHIAAKTHFDENLFIDDITKYISEALQYLQHSL